MVAASRIMGSASPVGDCMNSPSRMCTSRVEAVAQIQVGPAISGGNGLVHLDVKLAEFLDVGDCFLRVVEAVVGLRQSFLPGEHDLAAVAVVAIPCGVEARQLGRERLKAVGWRVLHVYPQSRPIRSGPRFMDVR